MGDKLVKKIKSLFTFENKLILIVTFIAGLITHFYFYTNECISPDALIVGDIQTSSQWEISLGRWGIKAIDGLRMGIVNNFLITIISIILLSITVILIVKLLKIKNPIIIGIVSVIMVTMPTIAETFMYIYCADSYCLAMLMSVLAVYLIYNKKSIKNYIFAVLCIIALLSLYQSYIGVTVALCIIIPILKLINNENYKNVLKDILKSIVITVIGIVLYYACTTIILLITNNVLSDYSGANNIGIKSIIINLPKTLLKTYDTFYQYMFKENIIYNAVWHRETINFIILALTLFNIIMLIIQNKTLKKCKINIALIIILLAILPIGINVINIIVYQRDTNLLMAMPYILIYILSLKTVDSLTISKENNILRCTTIVAIIVLIYTFILSNNASYMARKQTYNNYYETTLRILEKIESCEGYTRDTPVLIGGIVKYKTRMSIYGNGFTSNEYETWNGYFGLKSINNFYFNYMGTALRLCKQEDYIDIIKNEEYKDMPKFPDEGCVKTINGIVVVKLEDEPPI